MTKQPVNFVLSVLAVLFFMLPATSMAEDSPAPLSEMWVASPKAGQAKEFYAALAEHMALRSESGDPRKWQTFTPMLGDNLDRVAMRTCCFNWADQDSYGEWNDKNKAVDEHFMEHVAPHAENWEHYFESVNWENSHWVESAGPYKLFAVTEFHVIPGHAAEFKAARDKILQIALNQGWATEENSWMWSTTVGGKPIESIVVPHKNFASMDRADQTFSRFLSRHLGDDAAAALLQQFAASTKGSNFQIWELREEYSMSSDD